MALNGRPRTVTVPPLGASSPPSRCKSVDLPEPERPMIATRSPARISRSTPSRTGTGCGPWYVLLSCVQETTTSLIAQRFRRVDARGAPARVEGGDERQAEPHEDDGDHVRRLQVGRQLRDQVDVLRKELDAERVLDR